MVSKLDRVELISQVLHSDLKISCTCLDRSREKEWGCHHRFLQLERLLQNVRPRIRNVQRLIQNVCQFTTCGALTDALQPIDGMAVRHR